MDSQVDVLADGEGPSPSQITTLILVVNELATNAIKHAFDASSSGSIRIEARDRDPQTIVVLVDDDGLPFSQVNGKGTGLDLVKRLVASSGGIFVMPPPDLKIFEIHMPRAAFRT